MFFHQGQPISDNMEHLDHSTEKGQDNQPSEYLRAQCPLCFGGQRIYDPEEM
jgi:hypothetical protein